MLGKRSLPGRMIIGQVPIALAVGAGWGCLDIFSLVYFFFLLSSNILRTEIKIFVSEGFPTYSRNLHSMFQRLITTRVAIISLLCVC